MSQPIPISNPDAAAQLEQQLRQQVQQAQLAEAQKVLAENTQQ